MLGQQSRSIAWGGRAVAVGDQSAWDRKPTSTWGCRNQVSAHHTGGLQGQLNVGFQLGVQAQMVLPSRGWGL